MAGVLSFALGLESSAFAGSLDKAAGRLVAFLSVGKAVELAFEGIWSAIEQGGKLQDLSDRTGESVGVLYQLGEAFKVAGVGAESLPGMINRFNKSLSGVGDMGEKTDQAFSALGLSMADLKKMDAPAQLTAVAAKLATLDKGSGMDVASRLFGREGAGNIMQISRDVEGFKQTIADSAREAAVFARNASAFDKFGDTITRIKGSMAGMFAGVAEGIVPMIQQVADSLNELDLVTIGQNIGTMFSGAFQAFKEGKLAGLIGDTIAFGFESAVAMAPSIFAKLGITLLNVFKTPLNYLQAGMEYVVQKAMELIGKIPMVGSATGLDGFQAQSFGDIMAEQKATGPQFFAQGNTLDSMNETINGELSQKWGEVKDSWGSLFTEYKDFADRGPKAKESTKKPGGDTNTDISGKVDKPQVTAWEKIGAILGPSSDPNRETATNTRNSLSELRQIKTLLGKPSGAMVNK